LFLAAPEVVHAPGRRGAAGVDHGGERLIRPIGPPHRRAGIRAAVRSWITGSLRFTLETSRLNNRAPGNFMLIVL